MSKKQFFISLVIIGLTVICNATVWRLNNIPGVDADFITNLQDAVDGVTSGDTIYVEQSPFSYDGATISKQVILIGGGYWLTENDSTQASEEESEIGGLVFNPGSEGSIVSGFAIYHELTLFMITINTDNIIIERCFLYFGAKDYDNIAPIMYINGNLNNITIRQNWMYYYNVSGAGVCIYFNGDSQNVLIKNNFISSNTSNLSGGSIRMEIGSTVNSPQISNNIIEGEIHTFNCVYVNNILLGGNFYNGSGGIIANNLCNGTQFPDTDNNQQNVDMATVFVDHDLYIDNGYILAPGSPAIGAGFNGGDCGMFSNDYGGVPYVLSGLPAIPAIYEIDFNSTIFPSDENTLEVNVKAKSHN
ncbi:MAG: hypothetical protein K8S23_13330 [Candidatus Cloacimonetes bacterium]|nr:hypothetical protein [Candidatus Cloacimonadota bacterium]